MIEINNLSFSYTTSPPYILKDLTVKVMKGSYLSILGENGSAKSTLLKLILKLLTPIKGSIHLATKNTSYVPQKLESFNVQFPVTVYEILYCHAKALKIKDMNCITANLQKVGMLSFKDSLIGKLSGGQVQKVFIARALMGSPDLLILDEPSTGVDIQSQNEIYQIIKELNINMGVTVISVEHNLAAAFKNSSHILKLEKGTGKLYTIGAYKNHLEITENVENAEWVLQHKGNSQCIECMRGNPRFHMKDSKKLTLQEEKNVTI